MLRPLPPHIAHWLKMSGFILGMLHLREVSGKADPSCSLSEYPPVVSVLAMLFNVERKYETCFYLYVTVSSGCTVPVGWDENS